MSDRKECHDGLPPGVILRGKAYMWRSRYPDGRSRRIHLGYDRDVALDVFYRLHQRESAPLPVAAARSWILEPWRRARSNATKRGIPFHLTLEDAEALALASGGRCDLTGIAFDLSHRHSVKNRRPFVPSIDRIDSADSYRVGNVRLVCAAINIAIGPWGEAVFTRMVMGYLNVKRRGKQSP